MFESLLEGLAVSLSASSLIAMVVGVAAGMVLGALPGLSATMGVALVIPFTFNMDPLTALGLIAGIQNGASQGGAIPAILLRIPGTTGAIATCWDGYPMAQKGHIGPALRLSAASSAVGGVLSALALMLIAPPLATVALQFAPPEIFWINIFGLTAIIALVGKDVLKGLVSACLGLFLGTVGLDIVTGYDRYSFGILQLSSGLPVLVVMVGMFSLPPTLELATRGKSLHLGKLKIIAQKGIWKIAEVWRVWVRSSLIGIILGIVPGASGGTTFIAYTEARRTSKHPERFGKGSHEGLAAAEAVNNADNAASMIPTLTLGIPGGSVAVLIIGALMIQGLQPGPDLFRKSPDVVYGFAWQMFFTSLLLIPLGGIVASRVFANLLRVPPVILLPMIVCMMVAGTFAYENSLFHVYMMLGFGVLGLVMERFGFPIAPVVIGLVLGVAAEYNLRISLLMSHGDPAIFFTRPISLAIIALILLLAGYAFVASRKKAAKATTES